MATAPGPFLPVFFRRVSPRGAEAIYRAAQSMAPVDGRTFVTLGDGRRLGVAAERIIEEILTLIEVPL